MLKVKPYLSQKIWGGDKLSNIYNSELTNIGEALIVSGLENNSSTVIDIKGNEFNLRDYYLQNKQLFGVDNNEFPLLIKILDAKTDLSIQVHPSDEISKKMGKNYKGKQECWFILNTDNNSIIAGTKATSKQDAKSMVENKNWSDLAKEVEINNNDFISVEPGVVHAIKGGTTLFELQQPSDTTFRLYDYDRLENGKLRDLHIEESLECIGFDSPNITNASSNSELISNKFFSLYYFTGGSKTVKKDNFFTITNIDSKKAMINNCEVKQYETIIIDRNDNFLADIKDSGKLLISSI